MKEYLEQMTENLKQEFNGLTKEQKELLVYRAITEVGNNGVWEKCNQDINYDVLSCLVKAADINFLKPLIAYVMFDKKSKYQEVYKDSLVCYYTVLENYKKLAQELNINSALELSHLLTFMLWNGYFSVNKKHFYKLQGRLLLPGMYSFDVIKGKGVCLAYAELLHNYLATCQKKSALLTCKVPTKKEAISSNYRPEIERNVKNSISSKILNAFMNFFLGGVANKFGNHAITLIEENGKMYAYDPTNLYALNIKDSNTATIVNGKGEYKIMPLSTLMTNPQTDPNHLYEKLLFKKIEPALSRKEFIFSFEKVIECINSNISLLDDAYGNIHYNLEYIDRQTDEIGKAKRALKK